MKVLVAGNSQAGALRLALKEGLLDGEDVIRPDFYVVPGGEGPPFIIRDGKLVVTDFIPNHPPYIDPPQAGNRQVDEYDAILVSALGYVDGGFLFKNTITHQGSVADFSPREDWPVRRLISRSCMADIMRPALMLQSGFVFLRMLRESYKGRILVQPFPYSSAYMAEREDWAVRREYEDYLGFNRFLFGLRDAALRDICTDLHVDLLGPPDPAWSTDAFTPRSLMRDSDGLHPLGPYGAMVLRQVTAFLNSQVTS